MANSDSNIPFIEIIEWVETNPNVLMRKVCDKDKEIKNGAKLIVRESQAALFLNEGTAADVFTAGTHNLKTENIPILSKLKGWKYGFESPFKADVYYFALQQFVNLKWGTPAPIMMRDSQFGQVRVRAFGTYNVRIKDVKKFFNEYAGTFPHLTIFELEYQLRDYIAPKFGEVISHSNISVVDLAGNITDVSSKVRPLIEPYFENLGVEVTEFAISSVTLPQEVTKHYDNITNMNMIGDMDKYTKFQTAQAIGDKDNKMHNGVQDGVAMGAMMGAMQNQMQSNQEPSTSSQPTIVEKMKQLKELFENDLINVEEFKAKKKELMDSL
ncbi:MAG: SPFH domain-containing protein [Weeksellaceae bacterium]